MWDGKSTLIRFAEHSAIFFCRVLEGLVGRAGTQGSRENKALVRRELSTLIKDHNLILLYGAAMLEIPDEPTCPPGIGTFLSFRLPALVPPFAIE